MTIKYDYWLLTDEIGQHIKDLYFHDNKNDLYPDYYID